ncbi:hypothetical protein [Vampirovibrio sp.]|uniref:hypothetical protein n=1 Tax=Vampirovibrio sp. TaxID=2717857 RepID=UPI003594524A
MKQFFFGFVVALALAILVQWGLSTTHSQNAPTSSLQLADTRARQDLWEFSRQKNIPIWEFEGPFFSPVLNTDPQEYNVWYKHPEYYFYSHWDGDQGGVLKSNVKKEIPSSFQWLEHESELFDTYASSVTAQDKLALTAAQKNLAQYASANGLKVEDFKGPFVRKSFDASTGSGSYRIGYKHPEHYFSYTAVVLSESEISDNGEEGINIRTDKVSPFQHLEKEPTPRSSGERNTPWETWRMGEA